MAKSVTQFAVSTVEPRFGMNKDMLRIACDDGSTYVFERPQGSPRYRTHSRVDADGSRAVSPSRLPAAVGACMDGLTQSGPHGVDSSSYWVK